MKIVKFFFVVIAILLVVNVVITNNAVDESLVVTKLSHDITILSEENMQLRQEVAHAGSLINLQEKILALGFVDNPKIVSLSTTTSLALR